MYDQIEHVSEVAEIEHEITKNALNHYGFGQELTIASVSDVLCSGSGLGSSSAFTVGLCNVLQYLKDKDEYTDANLKAVDACHIEMNMCGYPIGKQDQFAAAHGGFNLFEFGPQEEVLINPLHIQEETYNTLNDNLLLVYSGRGRSANVILKKQSEAMADNSKLELVRNSKLKAYTARRELEINNNPDAIGYLLHEAWADKKKVVSEISQTYFDDIYQHAIEAGAVGGKLLGAGGGGFFLFYVKPYYRQAVIDAITINTDCKVYDFKFVNEGSKIILDN
jgi:D-glycero-alpha-D-manno-heptose-7-phosphate kinase